MTNSDNPLRTDYIHRINKALAFIDAHIDSELSLDSVANVAHYSTFHFHRIFKALIGETLNEYITRRRIEKCASILMHRDEVSITEVGLQYGFNSNSSFTRAFKNFYGVSPTTFRKQSLGKFSKIRQMESKNGQASEIFEKYICNIDNHLNWIKMNAKIEVKETPELSYASITHVGIHGVEAVFDKLIKWAKPKGLFENPEGKMARIYHDSFKLTAPDKVRMSICVLTPETTEGEGEVTNEQTPKGKYIVGQFEITPHDFETAWTSLYVWMNENGYQKANSNPFEIYHNDFREHPENKCRVDLYIPVQG